jgi:hypothetical protein
MRRLFSIFVVAATTVLVPMFAMAGNQEVADQIAKNLRQSGKMSDYHIAIKYQDGTATLKGRVNSQAQMNSALKVVFNTPGVSRVVNEMTVADAGGPALVAKSESMSSMQQAENEYEASMVQQVSAEEPSQLPQHVASHAARPLARTQTPMATQSAQYAGANGSPRPMYAAGTQGGVTPVRYDQPCMPNYAWPSYASYPNYAAVTYPKQYSASAWPYIGPFYPYPQVPLGWRKVTLQWSNGWWYLDFKDSQASCWR